ncbi:uncharacterized protein LOC121873900 [Homarus americanus]|nr:uncharacterized protein LOC121873900 [Homarus americanus]
MVGAGRTLVLMAVFLSVAQSLLPSVILEAVAPEVLQAVLVSEWHPRCSLIFLTDGHPSALTVFTEFRSISPPWGVALFEVAVDGQDANVTQAQLSRVVDEARRLRQVSWCVTVVVVSDDPAFLAAFAEWSLKGRLLVWPTRLLVVTRLPLPELHYLHKLLSTTNSMLLMVQDTSGKFRCSVYMYLPYSSPEDRALSLASWTPRRGLTLATHLPLFPDKYTRFLERPTLAVATEALHSIEVKKKGRDGEHTDNMVDYLGKALNFTEFNDKGFVVHKTVQPFSCIGLDHTHELVNP